MTHVGQLIGFSGVPYGLAGTTYHGNPLFGVAGSPHQLTPWLLTLPSLLAALPPQFPQPSQTSTLNRLLHVHPILQRHLEEYHQVFKGRLMFGRILKAENISWDNLPTLPEFVNEWEKYDLLQLYLWTLSVPTMPPP